MTPEQISNLKLDGRLSGPAYHSLERVRIPPHPSLFVRYKKSLLFRGALCNKTLFPTQAYDCRPTKNLYKLYS
jgi:hypothetical protein